MYERFTDEARHAVVEAQNAARALGHDWIGCEHLLIGLASQQETPAAETLASVGAGPEQLRAAVAAIVGPCVEAPDADALRELGIDLDEVRRRAEEAFGLGALERTRAGRRLGRRSGAIPFTPRAKKALELAVHTALARGDRGIGGEHVLLGVIPATDGQPRRVVAPGGSIIWTEHENLGLVVLDHLGISPDLVRDTLLRRLERNAA